MLFKLAVRNIRNSVRDYTVYFYTLVIGVAVFYSFNAIMGQDAVAHLTGELGRTAQLLTSALSAVSIFVAFVLGILIVFASRFLVKRRSKEFAVYMTLGMGKRKVSSILMMENLLTGIISLAAGLLIGIALSQLMGIFVINLFAADVSAYSFSISGGAIIRTIGYFAVMYLVAMLFNSRDVGRMKLIDLLQSEKKTEEVKLRNPVICVIVFLAGAAMLAFSYYMVGWNALSIDPQSLGVYILTGSVATFLVIWSVSGMMLRIVRNMKNTYYSGLNSFTFRQISSRINTVVLSMTLICLMLFFTTCALSGGFAIRNGINKGIDECPADFEVSYQEILFDTEKGPVFDDVTRRYAEYGYDITEHFSDYRHFHTYYDPELSLSSLAGESAGKLYLTGQGPDIVKLSDYNDLMGLYGKEPVELGDDEFILMNTYASNSSAYDNKLKDKPEIEVFGHTLRSVYDEVQDGFIDINGYSGNTGLIIIPDSAASEDWACKDIFVGNYSAETDEERADAEAECISERDAVDQRMNEAQAESGEDISYYLRMTTRTQTAEAAIGTGALMTIIGLYLGFIFLIASGAVLALRQLTDSVDSIPRYEILRKIGADEKEINRSLFIQTGVFFLLPLVLAAVHSIFGIRYASAFIALIGRDGLPSAIASAAALILLIYGGYFAITYNRSKAIISSDKDHHAHAGAGDLKKAALIWAVVMLCIGGLIITTANGSKQDYSTGTPWIDCDIEGAVTSRTEADIKDNFALGVNKEAILDLKIPDGYSSAGPISDMDMQTTEDIKALFTGERPESHDARLAYDLYGLMLDWDSRNEVGAAPLKEMTDRVESISSISEMTEYLTKTPYDERLGSLWSSGPAADLKDSDRQVLNVGTGGLLLGDSAEYKSLTESGRVSKEAYTDLSMKMLVKLGYDKKEAENKISNRFRFEKMLAEAIPTGEDKGKPDYYKRSNNHYTREELLSAEKGLPVVEQLENADGFPKADDYVVRWPAYLDRLSELYTDENLPLIRDYIIVGGIVSKADQLDRECYEWSEECVNRISGTDESPEYETLAAEAISGRLAWPVARLYTERYLDAGEKARITEMVNEILKEYHGIINDADFLSDETREKALEKLDAIDMRVLYPDSWEQYSCAKLNFASAEEGGTYWEANQAINRYLSAKEVEEYTHPVDKTKWQSTPQNPNCAYDPQTNSIYILGAYARGVMTDENMSDEELYAKLGTAIAHEISHAFDSKGAQFDKDGNMHNWWTEEDNNMFHLKNEKLAAYYNKIHPWEGQYLRGSIMTGEACADMAGMKCMLRIAAGKPGFDYDKFFRSYAGLWLTKDNAMMARARVDDPHPMPYLRVNVTLQQFDEFRDCYGIAEGDGMYLAPEERVNIW